MGLFIILLTSGCLLIPFGSFLLIRSIPASHPGASWDASWTEVKEAFSIMLHKRSFQVGLSCIIAGVLILWYIFWSISP